MKIAHSIPIILALIAVIFEGYLGIYPLVSFFIQVILLAGVIASIFYIVSSSPDRSYRRIFIKSAITISAVVGFFIVLIAGFVTYHNIYPASLSDVTLSDGQRKVVVLQMSHIASPDFFDEKQQKIQSLGSSGYIMLVEGVREGTPENHARFDAYMGFRFTRTLYDTLAMLTGFEAQDNDMLYTSLGSGSLVSVDLSIDELMGLMGTSTPLLSGEIPDIEQEFSGALTQLSSQDKKILNYIFRGLLNWTLKDTGDIMQSLMEGDRAVFFDAIIDKRNRAIIEYIHSHPDKNIVVVYGALHFNGVYAGLQKLSPNWRIESIEEAIPYR